METVTLGYTTSTGSFEVEMNVLSVRGFDAPDEWELFPPLQRCLLNGSIDEKITGYRRVITIDFGVIADSTKQAQLFAFIRNSARTVTYHGTELSVAISGIETYANEWIDGTKIARRYVLKCKEKAVQTIEGFVGHPSTY
jgi:hypothetical protein